MNNQPSRRTVATGLAWAAPVAVMAYAAPAFAASSTCPTTASIDSAFAAARDQVAAYKGCATQNPTFTIWYDGTGGSNGYLQSSTINVRSQNSCTIDTTVNPLLFRIDIVNLTGPDTNSKGDPYLQRSLTTTNSYGYLTRLSDPLVSLRGISNNTAWQPNGTATVSGATRTVYSAYWDVNKAKSVNAGEDIDIQFSWADGATNQGRLTNTYRLVPLGVAPPEWSRLTTADPASCPGAYAHYQKKVSEWTTNGYGCSPNITWEVATNVTTTRFATTSGYTRTRITCGTGLWSVNTKDFTPSHDGIY